MDAIDVLAQCNKKITELSIVLKNAKDIMQEASELIEQFRRVSELEDKAKDAPVNDYPEDQFSPF